MNTYYLRTVADDYPQLIALGKLLGAITEHEGVITAPGGCWDFIGPIHVPTGATIQTEFGPQPVMTPRVDALGNEYIHVNLVTPVNLRKQATNLSVSNPEIKLGLSNLNKYFLVDTEGNAKAPTLPYRIFAS